MAVLHLIEHESAGAEPETRGRGVPRRRGWGSKVRPLSVAG